MGRLQGKVAFITGGGGGIGAATAMLFAEEGAGLVLVDRDGAAAEAAAEEIRGRFPSADVLPVAADLSDEAETRRAMDAAAARFGGLDILVNVAGIRVYGALADADAGSWESILAVNLMATVHCCKAAVPLLRSRGGGKHRQCVFCFRSCRAGGNGTVRRDQGRGGEPQPDAGH